MPKILPRKRPFLAPINIHLSLFKVYRNWKRVVCHHVGVASKSCGIWTLLFSKQFFSIPLNLHTHRPREWTTLYSGCIGQDKTRTSHHGDCADCADHADYATFLFVCLFVYIWLRCMHVFLTLGNVRIVSVFCTPHEEILRDYFELTLTRKTKIEGSSFSSTWRLAPHGKMHCRCNFCGQRRWFRGKGSAVLTKQTITTIFTKQLNELYSKESAAN